MDVEDFLGTSGTTTEPMPRQAATGSQVAFPVVLIISIASALQRPVSSIPRSAARQSQILAGEHSDRER